VAGVSAVSVSPASGSGLQQTFTLRYSDGAGAADLSTVWVWFNPTPASGAPNPCLIYYSRPSNTLYLINDAGTGWLSVPVGSSAPLTNSQCSVNAASTGIGLSGTDLVMSVPITLGAAYGGVKNVSLFAAGTGANSGWQVLGSWNVR
jgi:hypothetical protein